MLSNGTGNNHRRSWQFSKTRTGWLKYAIHDSSSGILYHNDCINMFFLSNSTNAVQDVIRIVTWMFFTDNKFVVVTTRTSFAIWFMRIRRIMKRREFMNDPTSGNDSFHSSISIFLLNSWNEDLDVIRIWHEVEKESVIWWKMTTMARRFRIKSDHSSRISSFECLCLGLQQNLAYFLLADMIFVLSLDIMRMAEDEKGTFFMQTDGGMEDGSIIARHCNPLIIRAPGFDIAEEEENLTLGHSIMDSIRDFHNNDMFNRPFNKKI